MARLAFHLKVVAIGALSAVSATAQLDGSIVSLEHPAIEYRTAPLTNPVDELQKRLERGAAELAFDPRPGIGYLPALLRELGVPVESQLLVYSKTSFQQRLITPERPRALYFNDAVALGAVQAGVIEIAVQDADAVAENVPADIRPGDSDRGGARVRRPDLRLGCSGGDRPGDGARACPDVGAERRPAGDPLDGRLDQRLGRRPRRHDLARLDQQPEAAEGRLGH